METCDRDVVGRTSADQRSFPLLETAVDDFELAIEEELDGLLRLGRSFSLLVVVRRDMPLGLPPELVHQASVAIANATRVEDRVGVVSDRAIVAVMPDTDAAEVSVAADRIRTELSHRTNRRQIWSVMEIPNAEQYGTGSRVAEAVLELVA